MKLHKHNEGRRMKMEALLKREVGDGHLIMMMIR
jgi:hypothetical protein